VSPGPTVTTAPVGTLCVVLHTHLPWLAGHGAWPVGEEWLHQAWSASYLPLVDVLHELADEGRTDLVSLGLTPVLAAQLDDPWCLREHQAWLARWQLRAEELAVRTRDPHLREAASREWRAAGRAAAGFGRRWLHGGSAALRPLVDAGTVELLGGPATHPVLPLLPGRLAGAAVAAGLDDAAVRLGRRPEGVWAPECAVAPGLQDVLAGAGVRHLMVEEATLRAAGRGTDRVWSWGGGSGILVAGRDLALTDRVWSSRSGYPSGPDYQDFHRLDESSGFRVWRVTDPARPDKAPYDPGRAATAVRRDAAGFAGAVRDRLLDRRRRGEEPLAVVAWDTELFGHWWHEGPQFLAHALRMLPEAGVRVATLGRVAAEQADRAPEVELSTGSWGHGKDLRLWAGEAVADLLADQQAVAAELLSAVRRSTRPGAPRDRRLDAMAREALLLHASDWAFMVSRDSAAGYARDRHEGHLRAFRRLATGEPPATTQGATGVANVVVPHLDARVLADGLVADDA